MSSPRYELDAPTNPYGGPALPELDYVPSTGWIARLGYLLGALLLAGTVLGSVNPKFGFYGEQASGFDAHRYPWQALFEADGRLSWRPESAWILALSGSALALLAAVFLGARARAALGLLVAAVVGVALLPVQESDLTFCGLSAAVALLLAAAAAGNRDSTASGARRLALVALIPLAGLLFLPLSHAAPEGEEIDVSSDYRSFAVGTVAAVHDVVTAEPEPSRPPAWRLLMLLLPHLAWLLSLPVAILMLMGLGRPWAPWVLGVLLLVLILGHPVSVAIAKVEEARTQVLPGMTFTWEDAFAHAVRGASESIVLAERLMLLPLALGLVDLMRPRRPAV